MPLRAVPFTQLALSTQQHWWHSSTALNSARDRLHPGGTHAPSYRAGVQAPRIDMRPPMTRIQVFPTFPNPSVIGVPDSRSLDPASYPMRDSDINISRAVVSTLDPPSVPRVSTVSHMHLPPARRLAFPHLINDWPASSLVPPSLPLAPQIYSPMINIDIRGIGIRAAPTPPRPGPPRSPRRHVRAPVPFALALEPGTHFLRLEIRLRIA